MIRCSFTGGFYIPDFCNSFGHIAVIQCIILSHIRAEDPEFPVIDPLLPVVTGREGDGVIVPA